MIRKLSIFLFSLLFLVALYLAYSYFQKIFSESVKLQEAEAFLYVPTDASLSELTQQMYQSGILQDTASFLWVAEKKSFQKPIPGRYQLKDGMNNNQLVNLLRSGIQKPVRLTLNSSRTIKDLVSAASEKLELDSAALIQAIRSPEIAAQYGFQKMTFPCMFIPNTYEFYWNTSVPEFLNRMAKEYKRFWTDKRKMAAAELRLSQSEISILASIVQAEQQEHPDERARVAGLYLNRIRKGMRLQSDPTLIYALGDYSIKRVLNQHKQINSPFNTYLNAGLPPGPINIPEISSIDAVLYAEDHNYLYMCAKADFSGYHHFSTSLSQHNRYARAYQRELNRRKILQ